jgi:ribose transport system ATP-binding protein
MSKSFGVVQALQSCSLSINHSEILGIIGHNGAGKSTLVNILVGLLAKDSGVVSISGQPIDGGYSSKAAYEAGLRCVFQELSLCGNLNAIENTQLVHGKGQNRNWRKKFAELIGETLNEMFPDNKIPLDVPIGTLSIGERQMLEIARAFVATEGMTPKLVILDEPTSSLDASAAENLMAYLQLVKSGGVSSVLISHKLGEVISNSDRIVVMRDGGVIATREADKINRDETIALMGGGEMGADAATSFETPKVGDPIIRLDVPSATGGEIEFKVCAGEVIGLAGLDGHGQKDILGDIFSAFKDGKKTNAQITGDAAYVAGDRQREGVFPLWSIGDNIGIGSILNLGRYFIPAKKENELCENWFTEIGVRSPSKDMNIMTLSGGNQQKALVARAFASGVDTILLDDPTRGVDLQTKQDIYKRIRSAAHEAGKCAVWYSTETEEFNHCDRIYVFHNGQVTDMIPRNELSEARLVRSSFAMDT